MDAPSPLPQPRTPQELEAALAALMVPDTAQVKQATAILKKFLENPASLQAFMQQITASGHETARQMAAVLLRYKIYDHFKKLPEEGQENLKKTLLQRLIQEPNRLVRRSIGALVASLARKLVPKGKWNELLPFLLQCSRSQQSDQRYVSMLLFRALAEEIGTHLRPHFSKLQGIFVQGLSDPNESVQLESLQALNVLVRYLETEEEGANFRALVPQILTSIQGSIEAKKEEHVAHGFEILDNLSEQPVDVLMAHFPILVKFLCSATANKGLEINIRNRAGSLLTAIIQHKPGRFVKHKLVPSIVGLSGMLILEDCPNAFDTVDPDANQIGVSLLDAIALEIPHNLIYEPIMTNVQKLLKGEDEQQVKAGYVILATVADGFAGLLKQQLENLLQAICNGIKNPRPVVRASALHALNNFANYLQPEIITYHKIVINHLLISLTNLQEALPVKKKACQALEDFLEHMGDHLETSEVEPYIKPLLSAYVPIIKAAANEGLTCLALAALKTLAGSAQEKFLPYVEPTLKLLDSKMKETKDDMLDVRAYATDCVGEIAAAVGKEKFAPYLQLFLGQAMRGLELDYFGIREKTYSFFANLAAMLKADFEKLLETVMPVLVASCESDDGLSVFVPKHVLDEGRMDDLESSEKDKKKKKRQPGVDAAEEAAEAAADSEEDEEKDEDAVLRRLQYSIRSGALDEKVSAVHCLETIAIQVGAASLPYLTNERTLKALEDLSEYLHEQVRAAVIRCYAAILRLVGLTFPSAKVQKGQAKPMNKKAGPIVELIVPIIIQRLMEEEDKETAAICCETLTETAKTFGLAAFQKVLEPLSQALEMLVSEKGPAQAQAEEGVILDHDEVLIASAVELLTVTAEMMGPKIEPFVKKIMPALLKFAAPERPLGDREMIQGVFSDLADHLGAAIGPYVNTLFPIVLKALTEQSPLLRRNAAYCAGMLCQSGGQAAIKYYPPALTALAAIITTEVKDVKESKDAKEKDFAMHLAAAKDNATSAVARMIIAGPQSLPLPKATELFLTGLPITTDFEETKICYNTLLQLIQQFPKVVMPHLPKVIAICTKVLGSPTEQVEAAIQQQLVQLCKQLAKNNGPQIEPIIKALPEGLRNNFLRAVSS